MAVLLAPRTLPGTQLAFKLILFDKSIKGMILMASLICCLQFSCLYCLAAMNKSFSRFFELCLWAKLPEMDLLGQ